MKLDARMAKRICMSFIGVILMGFCIAIYNKVLFGTDPFTTFVMGLTGISGFSFGITQLAINLIVIILGLFFGRSYIGIGTVANMVGVGFCADFFTYLYNIFLEDPNNLIVKSVMFLGALIIHSFACSIFFTAKLGVGPYDVLSFMLTDRTKLNFSVCRIITDVTFVIAGFFLGGVVGVGTVLTALCMGPTIGFFNKIFSEPFLNGKKEKAA